MSDDCPPEVTARVKARTEAYAEANVRFSDTHAAYVEASKAAAHAAMLLAEHPDLEPVMIAQVRKFGAVANEARRAWLDAYDTFCKTARP